MPSFDVTSEVDLQEVRNAVDQAAREVATRFDFKGTGSSISLAGHEIELHAPTEDRLRALVQLLEEKLVRRHVSLKALSYGKVEEAAKGTVRQHVRLQAGIDAERAKAIGRIVRELGLKGLTAQTQGGQVRVSGKRRDDLQAAITRLKAEDLGIPLQFGNLRD
ncbi:MAG TPA: YajQ family cyclic di-GMP-binding protein [Acidimicrobiales bacterium]|nr:YajQ family cyclic di-GMP-binding protein [Acidimicrobiales bacterium]